MTVVMVLVLVLVQPGRLCLCTQQPHTRRRCRLPLRFLTHYSGK